jgi:hypothetical protein
MEMIFSVLRSLAKYRLSLAGKSMLIVTYSVMKMLQTPMRTVSFHGFPDGVSNRRCYSHTELVNIHEYSRISEVEVTWWQSSVRLVAWILRYNVLEPSCENSSLQ